MKSIYGNRILFVNDHDLLCQGIQRVLNKTGYQNVDIDSGKQVKKKLKENSYNLLIQDLQRPRPNGFELYYWMKKNEELANIPIILATVSIPVYMDKRKFTVIGNHKFDITFEIVFNYTEEEFGKRPKYIGTMPRLFVEGYISNIIHTLEDLRNMIAHIFKYQIHIRDQEKEFARRNEILWPKVIGLLANSIDPFNHGAKRRSFNDGWD